MADHGIFRTPETRCPGCGYRLDAALKVTGDGAPAPGNLTVCASCYQTLIFTAEMVPRDLTPAERAELDAHAEAQLDLERTKLALMAYWPKGEGGPHA